MCVMCVQVNTLTAAISAPQLQCAHQGFARFRLGQLGLRTLSVCVYAFLGLLDFTELNFCGNTLMP